MEKISYSIFLVILPLSSVFGQTVAATHDTIANSLSAYRSSINSGIKNSPAKNKDSTANLLQSYKSVNSAVKNSPAKNKDTVANSLSSYKPIRSLAKNHPAKADSVKLPVYGSAIKPKQH